MGGAGISTKSPIQPTNREAIVPPLYAHRKLDDKHRPKYIYTANELMQFGLAFFDLSAEALHLKLAIAHTLQP